MSAPSPAAANEFHHRIRQLCARVVDTQGSEFEANLIALATAIDSWQSNKGEGEQDNKGEEEKSSAASQA
jgi:hypothetical protein